jgi:hypothetical protein
MYRHSVFRQTKHESGLNPYPQDFNTLVPLLA